VKPWIKVTLAVLGVVVVAIAAIPLFVNAKTLRPSVEKQITATLGRNVTIGDLSLSLFSGGLVADDVSVADDPKFSAAPFLTAKELRIRVAPLPLILSHQVHVRHLQIEEPRITVIQAGNGTWNFSSLGGAAKPGGASLPELSDLSVGRIVIEDARITIASLPARGPASVYEHVNLAVRDFSFTSKFSFELTAELPADGRISAIGHAGPINAGGTMTSANATAGSIAAEIVVKHLDPVGARFLVPDSGVSFLADADIHVESDGQLLAASGAAHIQNLQLHKGTPAAPEPVDLTFRSVHHLKDGAGQIQDASVRIGEAKIRVSGSYQLPAHALDYPSLNVKLTGRDVPIDALQPLMTSAAVRLPNNSTLHGGTLSMDLAVKGPAKSPVITGPIALDNARLVGFDIGSKIHGIAALAGVKTGDTANIEKLSMDVRMTDAGIVVDGIEGAIAGLGGFSGSGTVSPADQLDFHLFVQVAGATGIAKVGASLLAKLNGSSGKGNGSGVPMHVTGPSDNPSITADVSSVLGKKK